MKERIKEGYYFTAGLKKNQVVGDNSFNTICKEIAFECGLDNPLRQTAQSLRSEHVCELVNSKENIDEKTIMNSTRHKTTKALNFYKRNSQIQLDKKSRALHGAKMGASGRTQVSFYSFYFIEEL